MEKYKISQQLGDGTYGTVYRGIQNKTGEIVAIKKMKKKFYTWNECLTLREVRALSKLNHPNIIKLKEVIKVHDELYLIFDYMEKNLLDYYQNYMAKKQFISNNTIKFIIFQISYGLYYIHKHSIFHRDLKPENILIHNEDVVKICDFGLSRSSKEKPPYSEYIATRWYRAPEILLKAESYGSEVDIFALGCIMAELYMLGPLFMGTSEIDQVHKICKVLGSPTYFSWAGGIKLAQAIGFSFPGGMEPKNLQQIIPNADAEAINLMQRMLKWNPEERIKAKDILHHPYFVGDLSLLKSIESKRGNMSSRYVRSQVEFSPESPKPLKKKVILSVSPLGQRQKTPMSRRVSIEQNISFDFNTSTFNTQSSVQKSNVLKNKSILFPSSHNSVNANNSNNANTEYLNDYSTNLMNKTRVGHINISNLISAENSIIANTARGIEGTIINLKKQSSTVQNSPICGNSNSSPTYISKDKLKINLKHQAFNTNNTPLNRGGLIIQSNLLSTTNNTNNNNEITNVEAYAITTKRLSEEAAQSPRKYLKPMNSLKFPQLGNEIQEKYFRGRQFKPNLTTKINTDRHESKSRGNIRSLGLSVNKHKDTSIPSNDEVQMPNTLTHMNNDYSNVQNDYYGLAATVKANISIHSTIAKDNSQEVRERNKRSPNANTRILRLPPNDTTTFQSTINDDILNYCDDILVKKERSREARDTMGTKIGILNNLKMKMRELSLQSKEIENINKQHYPNILMPVVLKNETDKVIKGILNKSHNHNKKTDIHNFPLVAKFKADINLKRNR